MNDKKISFKILVVVLAFLLMASLGIIKAFAFGDKDESNLRYGSGMYDIKPDEESVIHPRGDIEIGWKILTSLVCNLMIVLIIELLLAIIFKISNYKIIILINIFTGIIVQAIMLYLAYSYLYAFILSMILVVSIELSIYKIKMEGVDPTILTTYTIFSNLLSTIMLFII